MCRTSGNLSIIKFTIISDGRIYVVLSGSTHRSETCWPRQVNVLYVRKSLNNKIHKYFRWSYLRRSIRHYPQIRDMLAQASKCAVCGESFLNTWLECVRFVDAKGVGIILPPL